MLLLLAALISVLLQIDSIAAAEIDFEKLASLPPEVRTAFAKSQLAKRYLLPAHIKPFYLRGVFDGDGRQDMASLIKNGRPGKTPLRSITARRFGSLSSVDGWYQQGD